MNKKEKKDIISESIDLANGRYKDEEVETLYDMATNPDEYNGQTKTINHSFTSFCSDGKYTRTEKTVYTIKNDDAGLRIEENYSYYDDDGQTGSSDTSHDTGRDFLNILKKIFK